jgi:ribosomal-protein-alanine N-acetyltransferase
VPRAYSLEAACAWIARQQQRAHDGSEIVHAIVRAGSPLPVGAVWIFDFERSSPGPRIGYWILEGERRHRLATRAVGLLSNWAFEHRQIRTLYIELDRRNTASRGVAELVGARFDRHLIRTIGGVGVPFDRYALAA